MSKWFELIEERLIYQGFFSLFQYEFRHSLFAGGSSDAVHRELFRRGDCVAVVLYDPLRDAVVLLEQFRVGAVRPGGDPWLLEIVAGAMEEGETPEQVARRESREEAGCELRELLRISEFFTSPGGSSERITLFCGIVDSECLGGVHGLDEEDEDILVSVLPFQEAMALLANGRIESAIPIVGLQWLAMNRENLRKPYF
jgi:ADP-ribose pyrophosphatase